MRLVLFLMGFLIVMGCGQDARPQKPKNLISKNQMSDILYDIYILNAAKGINKKLLELKGVNPEDYIFEKYEIDSLQFVKSNDYYAFDVDVYETIINTVKERLDSHKIKVKEEQEKYLLKRENIKDSTKNIKSVNDKMRDSLIIKRTRILKSSDSLRQ